MYKRQGNNRATLLYNEALQNTGSNPPVDIRSICSNKKGKVFVVFNRDDIYSFDSNTGGSITLKEHGRQYGLNNTAIDDMLSDAQGNIGCNNSLGITPVSYTHLDVYKRQIQYLYRSGQ